IRKIILLHNNQRQRSAPLGCIGDEKTLMKLESEGLLHPVYFPDLAASDYHLFRSMQHFLKDTLFRNYEEVQKWIDEWITSKDRAFFRRGIQ
ncbi:Histone-lysine N-methyltransferase SETMAR, partial [Harpegnathos saltator]